MEFLPFADYFASASAHWVWLAAEISDQRIEERTIGSVLIETSQWPPITPPRNAQVQWVWRLLPEDLERIEQNRADSPKNPITGRLVISGIVQVATEAIPVLGEGTFQIPSSEWETFLEGLNYRTPPKLAATIGSENTSHALWPRVEDDLRSARARLRLGDDQGALSECVRLFEKVVPKANQIDAWNPVLSSFPDKKRDALARLFASYVSYLKRATGDDASDEQPLNNDGALPINHWEADLAVGVAQFLLMYALRGAAKS
jgi:hypothetical protein